MNPLLEELGRLRLAAGVSQLALARLLGVSRQSVHRKLTGKTPMTVGEAYMISRAVGSTLQDVLDSIDDRTHDVGLR